MALTMTRTRTQTTLTKLALMVAAIHGELEWLEGLIATHVSVGTGTGPATSANRGLPDVLTRLESRKVELVRNREALYATVRQFDARIDPGLVGQAQDWKKRFGRPCKPVTFQRRYLDNIRRPPP